MSKKNETIKTTQRCSKCKHWKREKRFAHRDLIEYLAECEVYNSEVAAYDGANCKKYETWQE